MIDLGIVDAGSGNLRSVVNAFVAIGCAPRVIDNPADLSGARRVVLPGVGAFRDGMQKLTEGGWVSPLDEHVRQRGRPLMGLCLGMQLLATLGTEHGEHPGLGWIDATVDRITSEDRSIRVPHMGWNDVTFDDDDCLYAGLASPATFYFVHSYVMRLRDPSLMNGECTYHAPFAASVAQGNVVATQFHPEKSQGAGLRVLTNFLDW